MRDRGLVDVDVFNDSFFASMQSNMQRLGILATLALYLPITRVMLNYLSERAAIANAESNGDGVRESGDGWGIQIGGLLYLDATLFVRGALASGSALHPRTVSHVAVPSRRALEYTACSLCSGSQRFCT